VRARCLLSLALLAGCGKNAAPAHDLGLCGYIGERCCDGDKCDDGTLCVTGFCQVLSCGEQDQRCCFGACNNPDDDCVYDFCRPDCGHLGKRCCMPNLCYDAGTACYDGMCAPQRYAAGGPCQHDTDCWGGKPVCMLKGANGETWPDGYCTSGCNPKNNNPQTGNSPDCPGSSSTCLDIGQLGSSGSCMATCTAMSGAMPCRSGYACFDACDEYSCVNACRPSSESQCDPTDLASCGMGMGCLRLGPDNVGLCDATCDPFAQDCSQKEMSACYVFDDTGRGFCSQAYTNLSDGEACQYVNECAAGLGCFFSNGNAGVCRPFCGGPMNVPCSNGMSCVDFSTKVKVAIVGVCGG
jgi:hypothetical protein